jgi:hypothetical protein
MSSDRLPEDTEASGGEKATIEYSFTMRLKGVSQAEIDHFVADIDGWTIKPGPDKIFLFPRGEDGIGGNASEYLHGVISRHGKVFAVAAQIGTSREIDLAVYFDANRLAAIFPSFDADVIRKLADLNFSLMVSVYPSSFDDDEGTEE